MENVKSEKRLIMGVILLLVGAALLANNFNLIPWEIRQMFWHWPMLLIIIGLVNVLARENKMGGVVVTIIGVFFMAPYVFDFDFNFRELFWPAILILIGLLIILKGRKDSFFDHHKDSISDDQDYIDDISVFGGGDRIITSSNFKGGKITAIFGGSNINFNRANLSKGKNVLDIFVTFGGTKLIVPEEWDIKINVVPIFGGFVDKRTASSKIEIDKEKQLVIKGIAIFGGGELRNF